MRLRVTMTSACGSHGFVKQRISRDTHFHRSNANTRNSPETNMPPHERATARYGLRHILYPINATADTLVISRPGIYDLVKQGKLELIKLGPKKSRITAESIANLLDDLRGIKPG
jgi:hypothetical protein